MAFSLEDILERIEIRDDKALLPLDVLEELLEEVFFSPEKETKEILDDRDLREAIEKFKRREAKIFSLDEAKKSLGIE